MVNTVLKCKFSFRPNKINVVFPLSLLKKIGSVGREFLFFILSEFFIAFM